MFFPEGNQYTLGQIASPRAETDTVGGAVGGWGRMSTGAGGCQGEVGGGKPRGGKATLSSWKAGLAPVGRIAERADTRATCYPNKRGTKTVYKGIT